jgi:beta-glucosidase
MNGKLDGLNPKLVVLYFGSNNIRHPSTDEIPLGVTTTIHGITRRFPNTIVLYLKFNPRGDITPVGDTFDKYTIVNQALIVIHDGKNNTIVFDMFNDLILTWGQINQNFNMPDKLHLNLSGYLLWDRLCNSTFFEGLNP